MPQLDKVTILHCLDVLYVTYIFVYIDGQVSNFFKFLTSIKFKILRWTKIYWATYKRYLLTIILLEGPWWELDFEY